MSTLEPLDAVSSRLIDPNAQMKVLLRSEDGEQRIILMRENLLIVHGYQKHDVALDALSQCVFQLSQQYGERFRWTELKMSQIMLRTQMQGPIHLDSFLETHDDSAYWVNPETQNEVIWKPDQYCTCSMSVCGQVRVVVPVDGQMIATELVQDHVMPHVQTQ